ncbi:MAG: CARDB domain-containing protein, partial [Phycisphaerales bacterium]
MQRNTLSINLIVMLTIAAFAAHFATPAEAWVYGGYWNSNSKTLRAASGTFPPGDPFRTALSVVVNTRFYNNPSEFYFSIQWGDSSVGVDNGQSEVWASSNSAYDPAICIRQYSWWYNNRIVEADVIFFSGVNWSAGMNRTSLTTYGGSLRPFRTTCMHEIGHAAGLNHENDEYNIMGQDWDHIHLNGNTARCYLGEDASDGLIGIYGRASGGSFEDVSVSAFEYSGASGEYSTHGWCDMTNSSNGALSWFWNDGMKTYRVNRGQTVRVEFTYENNGETTQNSVPVGYYISGNSTISTGDTLIATRSINLGRADVSTNFYTVTIPSNLTRNQYYWLGVIVDRTNVIAETDGNNNYAYQKIYIN